jgi:hypothetical protein
MRILALTLLAGLLAVTAPTAQALCAVDEEGGCDRLRHMVVLDVDDACPDGKAVCIVAQNESLAGAPNDADWAFRVHNGGSSAITLELFAIGFYDEDGEPVTGDRIAAQKLATLQVAAGQDLETDFATLVPGNVSHVRVQVLTADGQQAEQDAELSNYRIFMMQPGEAGEEPQGNLDDDVPAEGEGKDAPAPTFALLVGALAALAVAAGFRRD